MNFTKLLLFLLLIPLPLPRLSPELGVPPSSPLIEESNPSDPSAHRFIIIPLPLPRLSPKLGVPPSSPLIEASTPSDRTVPSSLDAMDDGEKPLALARDAFCTAELPLDLPVRFVLGSISFYVCTSRAGADAVFGRVSRCTCVLYIYICVCVVWLCCVFCSRVPLSYRRLRPTASMEAASMGGCRRAWKCRITRYEG